MNIKWIFWTFTLPFIFSMSPAYAWRCEHGFVKIGDTARVVRNKCSQPDFIFSDTGVYRRGRFAVIDEHWYYNYGPNRLLQELRFHKGVLEAVDTLGYGFTSAAQRCTPQDIHVGMSAYELAIRCGKPKKKRNRFTRSGGGKRSGVKIVTHAEEWTYDFGSQYFLQKVVITGGRVQSRENVRRTRRRSKHSD
jgi:hypothetical protein